MSWGNFYLSSSVPVVEEAGTAVGQLIPRFQGHADVILHHNVWTHPVLYTVSTEG